MIFTYNPHSTKNFLCSLLRCQAFFRHWIQYAVRMCVLLVVHLAGCYFWLMLLLLLFSLKTLVNFVKRNFPGFCLRHLCASNTIALPEHSWWDRFLSHCRAGQLSSSVETTEQTKIIIIFCWPIVAGMVDMPSSVTCHCWWFSDRNNVCDEFSTPTISLMWRTSKGHSEILGLTKCP